MTDRVAPDLNFVADIVKTSVAKARRVYDTVSAFPPDPGLYEVGTGADAGQVWERATQGGTLTRRADLDTVAGGGIAALNDALNAVPGALADIAQSEANANAAAARADTAATLTGYDLPRLLRMWTQGEDYEPTAITRNSDGLVTTATVTWPDGSAGTLTATNYNATHGVYDGYTITHTASGKTVTQAAVTRDSNGAATVKPALVVN